MDRLSNRDAETGALDLIHCADRCLLAAELVLEEGGDRDTMPGGAP